MEREHELEYVVRERFEYVERYGFEYIKREKLFSNFVLNPLGNYQVNNIFPRKFSLAFTQGGENGLRHPIGVCGRVY